jgi:hypothetical protein
MAITKAIAIGYFATTIGLRGMGDIHPLKTITGQVRDWASAAVGDASLMARPASGMNFIDLGMRCRRIPYSRTRRRTRPGRSKRILD